MIQQYNPQRYRIQNGRKVGTIPVGTIAYLWNRKAPWIVTGWLNRQYATRSDFVAMTGGHLATIKNLRTGENAVVADHWLLRAVDA